MTAPILTLTTDFGTSDHYVGAMKGAILSICPRAQIVDICHHVTPFAIGEGAYTIAQAYPYFPKDAVHVVVVDPGVGSARRPILVEAAGQLFVGPDNGVLAMVCARERHKVRLIANDRYYRKPVSATFHGRDIFAPVAAHLAAGVAPVRMGKRIEDYAQPDFAKPQRRGERAWSGRILKIDHFGNIVTNFHVTELPDAPLTPTMPLIMTIRRHRIGVLARNYAEAPAGKLVLIIGSSGYLEVSVNQGSAAGQIGCKLGDSVSLKVG